MFHHRITLTCKDAVVGVAGRALTAEITARFSSIFLKNNTQLHEETQGKTVSYKNNSRMSE